MEQKSNNQRGTFNLMCYLKKSKALKNGEIPVYMRITANGRVVTFSMQGSVPVSLWSQEKEKSKGKDRAAHEDANGRMWIRKPRQKTNNMCNISLLRIPQDILELYEDDQECQLRGQLLPVPTNQKLNAYLKELADLCGINKRLTSHVARHSFSTSVALANKVSMENVAKMLGHSSTRMTQHYARILDQSIL